MSMLERPKSLLSLGLCAVLGDSSGDNVAFTLSSKTGVDVRKGAGLLSLDADLLTEELMEE